MASATVYKGVAENESINGTLFAGKKFFLTMRLPFRSRYRDDVESNGGVVVHLEKKADYVIADHFRRDCPPGSISYTFIEQSLKDGVIADPQLHLAGPAIGTLREAGSSRPPKRSKTPYTAEDDRLLYKWVKDHERQGTGLSGGNELYKQLEKMCPRHTWQSWRDRYLKRLKDNPPSGVLVPDNAPPSPSSVDSPDQGPPVPVSTKIEEKAPSSSIQRLIGEVSRNISSSGPRTSERSTEDELRELFDEEEYEELYANVETIRATGVKDYRRAWEEYAEGNPYTAEQWRLFFEKVVQPDWQKDPTSKKEAIKEKVYQRHEQKTEETSTENIETAEPSTPKRTSGKPKSVPSGTTVPGHNLFDTYVETFLRERPGSRAQEAYIFWAREKDGQKSQSLWEQYSHLSTEQLHDKLLTQWHALPETEKAPYTIMENADKRRAEIERQSSSSAAAQETPDYITEAHRKIMKRISDGDIDEFSRYNTSSSPFKRRKRESPSPEHTSEQRDIHDTRNQPLEIPSAPETTSSLDDETKEQQQREESTDEVIQSELVLEDDNAAADEPTPTTRQPDVHYPQLERHPITDLPPDSPTPRKPREQGTLFDTQAVLSSPSHPSPLRALPLPQQTQTSLASRAVTPEEPSSSPIRVAGSEASVSESLQEFRRSLQDTRDDSLKPDTQTPSFAPIPPPEPSVSSQVSDTSSDPDPPLEPREFDEFFTEQREHGFTDEEIRAALGHTFCRPMLTVEVLDAWKDGKYLPRKRGIWSAHDDREVESGDGLALAKLEKLHTDKGWGGIEERLAYLEAYRRKTAALNNT